MLKLMCIDLLVLINETRSKEGIGYDLLLAVFGFRFSVFGFELGTHLQHPHPQKKATGP